MKPAPLVGLALVLAALTAACHPGYHAPPVGVVTFEERAPEDYTAQTLPRLVGSSAEIQAINADLALLDAIAASPACPGGELLRHVAREMTGPDFISFRMNETLACDGADYGTLAERAVTYDLSTGQRIDWAAMIPALGLIVDPPAEGSPQGAVRLVRSRALAQWYADHVFLDGDPDPEFMERCGPFFDMATLSDAGFQLWASGASAGVSVRPELPDTAIGCEEVRGLDEDALFGMGADLRLMAALRMARDAGNYGE